MTVVVRPPVLEDVDRLAAINSETWRGAYDGIVPASYLDALDPGTLVTRWRRNLTEPSPGVSFLVAEIDAVVASYAIVGPYRRQQDADTAEDTTGWGELCAIYTDPDLQGRGAGGAVHDAAMTLLRDDGYVCAALWVLADNVPGLRWYAARGWHLDGASSRWTGAGSALDEVRLTIELAAA